MSTKTTKSLSFIHTPKWGKKKKKKEVKEKGRQYGLKFPRADRVNNLEQLTEFPSLFEIHISL